jgi:hypothetical protein
LAASGRLAFPTTQTDWPAAWGCGMALRRPLAGMIDVWRAPWSVTRGDGGRARSRAMRVEEDAMGVMVSVTLLLRAPTTRFGRAEKESHAWETLYGVSGQKMAGICFAVTSTAGGFKVAGRGRVRHLCWRPDPYWWKDRKDRWRLSCVRPGWWRRWFLPAISHRRSLTVRMEAAGSSLGGRWPRLGFQAATPLGRCVVETRGLGLDDPCGGGQGPWVERGYVGLGCLGLPDHQQAEACMCMQGGFFIYVGQLRVSDLLHIHTSSPGVFASLPLPI